MAIQYLRPIANSATWNSWTASAGNKWDCVDAPDESTPSDATYIISSGGIGFQGFEVTPRNPMVSIDGYTAYIRARKNTVDWTVTNGAAAEAGVYYGSNANVVNQFTFTTYSAATGGITKSRIEDVAFRILAENSALTDANISMHIAKMTYTPPAGGFVFLLGQYFAPFIGLIGSGMLRCEFDAACELFKNKFYCTRQWEKDLFWDAFKSWTHPSYFDMGGLDAYTSCTVG